MKNFSHRQVQEILRSGQEVSDYDREALLKHLSACTVCQSYASLVAELGQAVPKIYALSQLSKQEIHQKIHASRPRLWRLSMWNWTLRSTRTIIWLGASLVALLILILLTPRLIPKPSGRLPTLPLLTSTSSSPIHKITPTKEERTGSIQYTVEEGENLFSIAKKFGLKPQTILWVNTAVLQDNPNNIKAGIELRIPSTDGLYYRWKSNDTIQAVANQFSVDTQVILTWPENVKLIGTPEKPDIKPGTLLFIPGGKIPLQSIPTVTP